MNEAPTTQKGILAVRLSLTLPVTVTELVLELTCVCISFRPFREDRTHKRESSTAQFWAALRDPS